MADNQTFEVSPAVSAQGTKIYVDTGTSGFSNFVPIEGVSEISSFDGNATDIDTTSLSSKAKERTPGLQDNGKVTLTTTINLGDAGQAALYIAKQKLTKCFLKIVSVDNWKFEFYAFVTTFPLTWKVDDVVRGNITLTVSGDVVTTNPQGVVIDNASLNGD